MKKILQFIILSYFLISCNQNKEVKLYTLKELQTNEHLFKLDSLPKNLNTVLRLNLSGTGIKKIPEIVFNMKNLQELDLSQNGLNNIEGIEKLDKIQYLNLGMNNFNNFPLEITKLKHLKEIGLWWNNFKNFPDDFYMNNTELEALDITSLYEFDFENNLAKIHQFKNLKRLNLGANLIPKLTLNFKNLNNLEEFGYIHQEKIDINSLIDSLSQSPNLRIIHFSGNKINSIPTSIQKLQNLEELNLFQNNISSLPLEVIKLKKLKEISLIDNPVNEKAIKEIEVKIPNVKIIY